MFTFQTRYSDMTFEGIPEKGPSIKSVDSIIRTEDEAVAKLLRGRKDVWEITQIPQVVAGAKASEAAPEVSDIPKRKPGRPPGVRGSRMSIETQGESQ